MKPGDVVRLKSGGPPMTVEYVRKDKASPGDSVIQCVWFDHSPSGAGPSGPHRSGFAEVLLDLGRERDRPEPTTIPGSGVPIG
jgi:uncharacterized protein YodC (DUF2158 family)